MIWSFAAARSSPPPTSAKATLASKTAASSPWRKICRAPHPRSTLQAFLVLPGGIDSHVHLDQPMGPGIVMADGFESGTRSAAAGGNTTVLCVRAAAARAIVAPERRGLPQEGEREELRRLRIPPHRHRSDAGGAGPGAAGAGQLRLSVVQGVHDLRQYGSDRPAIARSVHGRARTGRARDGPRGRLRPDQVHDRSSRARRQDPLLLITRNHAPNWSSAKRPTARSRMPS